MVKTWLLDNGIMGDFLNKLIKKPLELFPQKVKNMVQFQVSFLAQNFGITHFFISRRVI